MPRIACRHHRIAVVENLCPAPDEVTIRDEFRRVRELGFNMVKMCLYVPSPLYLDIADEEGMLLWLELPMWLPEVTPRLRQQAPNEYAAIMAAVHHHPSIVIYSLGCELNQSVSADCRPDWCGTSGVLEVYRFACIQIYAVIAIPWGRKLSVPKSSFHDHYRRAIAFV